MSVPTDRDSRPAAAALAALSDVGPARLRGLLALGPPLLTWQRLREGRPPSVAIAPSEVMARWVAEAAAAPDLPAQMADRLARLGVRVELAEDMPDALVGDQDPPVVLFCSGSELTEGVRVAVVGTRRATAYGLRCAERLGRDLSEAGICVVSGLALGIDAAAHRGALQGPTPAVAVVGAGHHRPCPVRNRSLAAELAVAGTVLSEVPPGVKSAPWRFPVRNRLIAALAQVVVVVESASAGGSMSTVREALDRDRSVMAVPGPIDRQASTGCHDLLRDGAEICTGIEDVLGLLRLGGAELASSRTGSSDPPDAPAGAPVDPVQAALRAALAEGPLSTDAALAVAGVGLGELAAAVSELERRGIVCRRAGWLELVP